MGSFERFKTKTHFNSLKRLVGVTALAALAVKLLTIALATAAGGGTPLDLLARVPASVADLGAALLVFEVLRSRRPLQLAGEPGRGQPGAVRRLRPPRRPGRGASAPAGCWPGRWTRGWPGGCSGRAARWCWPRRWCRR